MPFGPWGLGAIAFFDSAFLPLPTAIDVWVIRLSIRHPSAVLLHGTVATIGSMAGCLILYYIARKGGHAAAERKVGKERLARIRVWFEKHEFLTVIMPSLMPPPTPFKAFIITAGVIEVHTGKFLLALAIGRAVRYFSEAFLAVRYGHAVWDFALANGPLMFAVSLAGLLTAALIFRILTKQRERRAAALQPTLD